MSIKKIKFGCTPSLPAVYDESLSFLEAQGVVVKAVNDCIENVNELEGIVEGVTDDVEDLKSRMQTAEGDIDALEGRMDSAESDIDVLEETMQGVQSDISSLGERMGTAEGDIDALEGRMNTAEGDIDTLEGKMESAEGDIDALESRMDTAEGNIDALEGRVGTAEDDIDVLEGRMSTAESDISAINERIGSSIAPSFTWSGTIAPNSFVNVGEFEFYTEKNDRQADVMVCVELNVALGSGASSMLVTIGLALNGVPEQYTYQTYVNDGYNVLTVNFKTSELLAGNYVGSVYISTNANGSV